MLQTSDNSPLVSIIIPVLNRAHLITETLESVLSQTYNNWECIIVDDGSVDDTVNKVRAIMKKDCRFKYYKRPSNYKLGGNGARNYGFIKSQGEYIKWFDSDDILEQNVISDQIKACAKSRIDISICSFKMFYGDITNTQNLNPNLKDDPIALFNSFINGQSIINLQMTLWKRSAVEKYNFNENLTKAQDLAFVYKVLKKNKDNVVVSSKVGCWIRNHANSITSNFRHGNFHAIRSEYEVREMIFNENFNAVNNMHIGTLRMLLYAYRKLLLHNFRCLYFKKMLSLYCKIPFLKKVKMFILIFLSCFNIITKRGNYQIGIYIKSF